jgi:cysteinyl-tRNA synthetase
MSTGALGQPFDIHTGGIDLIFPHHENEIAQSTAASNNPTYAQFFVHNEHLLVDGRKMSKSLNNFFTLRDIQERGSEPLAYRMLVLQAHYRTQLNFSWENLDAAQARLKRWRNNAVLRFQAIEGKDVSSELTNALQAAKTALENDLDTPGALSHVETAFDLVDSGLPEASMKAFNAFLRFIDDQLGLDLLTQPDITYDVKELLEQRQTARLAKNWVESDKLRDKLLEQGIEVRDTATGQLWACS